LTPTKSFSRLGVITSVPLLAKIDHKIRPRECGQTDKQTHAQTEAN